MSVEQSINLVYGQVVEADNTDVLKHLQDRFGNDLYSDQYEDLLTFSVSSDGLHQEFPLLSSTVHTDMVSDSVETSLTIYVSSSLIKLKQNSSEISERAIRVSSLVVDPEGAAELDKFCTEFGLSSPSWVVVSRIF